MLKLRGYKLFMYSTKKFKHALLIISLLLAGLFSSKTTSAQKGGIAGLVIDAKSGKELIGISVFISNSMIGDATDIDGRYLITDLDTGIYTLIFTSTTHKTKVISDIEVTKDEVSVVNVDLEDSAKEMTGAIITGKRNKKETTANMLLERKNAVAISDGISLELIKRTPDKSTAEALRRISSSSLFENKYIIIRGISDRYNIAYMNYAPIASSVQDRKAFSFDAVVSNAIDNLMVIKSYTPDLPGDFGGGLVQMNTRDFPDDEFTTVLFGTHVNSQSTMKKGTFQPRYMFDDLGLNDPKRNIPVELPNTPDYQAHTPAKRSQYSKGFDNDFALTERTIIPGLYFQFANSSRFKYGKHIIGSLLGINYSSTKTQNTYSRNESYNPYGKIFDIHDNNFNKNITISAIYNFSLKINKHNKLSFKNNFDVSTFNQTKLRTGFDHLDANEHKGYTLLHSQNVLAASQLQGEHYFKTRQLKFKWVGSYSYVNRIVPSYRNLLYERDSGSDGLFKAAMVANTPNFYSGGRFYSELDEHVFYGNYSIAKTIYVNEFKTEMKAGGFHQVRYRRFRSREFGYTFSPGYDDTVLYRPVNTIFDPVNIGPNKMRVDESSTGSNNYEGQSTVNAFYFVFDNIVFRKLRLNWGARLESFNLKMGTRYSNDAPLNYDTTTLSILPAVNLTWSFSSRTNFRISGSKTLIRPDFRELAPFRFNDIDLFSVTTGNPDLVTGKILHFDIRYEYYPAAGQTVSIGAFYKNFTNPIELVMSTAIPKLHGDRQFMFVNAKGAQLAGAELELRKKLDKVSPGLRGAILFGNLAYMYSKVDVSNWNGTYTKDRAMQGQSPYVMNAGLTYNKPGKKWATTFLANRIGSRIYSVGTATYADIYEKPRTVIDFQYSRNLSRKTELRISLQDLLAQKFVYYQNTDTNKNYSSSDHTVGSTKLGMNVQITVQARF